MNLYKIIFSHHSPKDMEVGMKCLLIAKDDEAVYEWLKNADKIGDDHIYLSWGNMEEENKTFDIYNDEYDVIGTENFKEKIIRIKGEINDEEYDFSSSYYGITLYGWELLKEKVNPKNYKELQELGILFLDEN